MAMDAARQGCRLEPSFCFCISNLVSMYRLERMPVTTAGQRQPSLCTHHLMLFQHAARGAEDEGWLLCICYDARGHNSECVILEARDMVEVATLNLRHALPHGLHGVWSADHYGPSP